MERIVVRSLIKVTSSNSATTEIHSNSLCGISPQIACHAMTEVRCQYCSLLQQRQDQMSEAFSLLARVPPEPQVTWLTDGVNQWSCFLACLWGLPFRHDVRSLHYVLQQIPEALRRCTTFNKSRGIIHSDSNCVFDILLSSSSLMQDSCKTFIVLSA